MKKTIEISKDARLFIKKVFGVTDVMIWKALSFDSDSELARRIRHMAVDRGGKVMVTLPEEETIYTHDRRMIQTFSNGWMLEIEMDTGACEVFRKGKMVRRYHTITIPQLEQLQAEVAAM